VSIQTRFLTATLICISAIAATGACFAQQTAIHPHIVPTHFATSDYVIASVVATESPFSAPVDGKTDATAAIQSAVDSVAQSGGGVVFLPAGRYLCTGNLTLKEGVTLRGDYKEPDGAINQFKVAGTILMPTSGRGDVDGLPFIKLQRGSGIRNLSIWYPDQDSNNIVAYPWTVGIDPTWSGDCFTIEYVTLVNSYQGIKFGPMANEIGTIRHVYGAPLLTGVSADAVYDIPRIEHTRFSPAYWTKSGLPGSGNASAVNAQILAHATGVETHRVDWYFLFDVATYGYSVGFHFTKGEHGTTNGVMYNVSALGGDVGVRADETMIHFLFTNCRFDGATAAVYATPRFTAELQFNNCTLGGQAKRAIRLEGPGIVKAQNTRIIAGAGPAVEATAGQLQLISCKYPGAGVQVVLARHVDRAIILGGLAKKQVENHSRSDIQIDPVSPASLAPGNTPVVLPPDRRPAKPAFFNVMDFGAKADGDNAKTATDNTSAFQHALDAAGKAGGGTVYVPAGSYRFHENLRVPSGVEMRGAFDVPHHTISWGSTLMPTAGRGLEQGLPFICLEPNSGARGLTFWYPDQKADDIVPYPWTIRSLGPSCWLIDVTTANSYQFVDFGSYPSKGSLLRFVSGSPLRRGIWVSKGNAEVDDGMFNEHYWIRRPGRAPSFSNGNERAACDTLMDYTKANLDAFIFGDCPQTQQVDNFVFGCKHGLLFVADNGRASAGIVINHGSDGSTEGLHVDAAAPAGLQLINAELCNDGIHSQTALDIAPTMTGSVNIFNGETWGRSDLPTMLLHGQGHTTIENWGTHLQEYRVSGGALTLEGCTWSSGALNKQIVRDGPMSKLELIGNASGDAKLAYDSASVTKVFHNGAVVPLIPLKVIFHTGFEAGDPVPAITAFAPSGMKSSNCSVVAGAGKTGGAGLVLSGIPASETVHGIAYFAIYNNLNLTVTPNMVMRYWIKPGTPMGMRTGLDLTFTKGLPLRDSQGQERSGSGSHPCIARGVVGLWRMIEIPLANQTGRVINQILVAYDAQTSTGPVQSTVDDIEIGEAGD